VKSAAWSKKAESRLNELVRRRLAQLKDPHEVVVDPNALYSGAKISEKTLVPGTKALQC
jgi:hypothetical protein